MESLYLVDVGIKLVSEQRAFIECLDAVPKLYEVDLSENPALKVSEFLMKARDVCRNLETLIFADNQNMGQYSCDAVLDQERNGIHQLKRLDLEKSLNYPENLHFLLQSTALQSLQYLNLSSCNLNDEYVRDLFNSDLMLTVEYLRLANNKLTAGALPMKIISRDQRSRDSEIALKFLDLRYNPI